MRRLVIPFFFFSLKAQALCLLTFNTYGAAYAPRIEARAHATVREIKALHSCEFINFQEVFDTNQTTAFEFGLPKEYQAYAPNKEKRHGLMAFSRLPWVSTVTYDYKVNYDDGAIDTVRRWVGARKAFSVLTDAVHGSNTVNTHLHPSSSEIRIMQIIDLFHWRLTDKNRALILNGDFNSEPSSLEYRLVKALLDVEDSRIEVYGKYTPDVCTYCENNPRSWLSGDHVFDYIFLSYPRPSRFGWKALKSEVVLKGTQFPLSDHYGVRADFERVDFDPQNIHSLSKSELIDVLVAAELQLAMSNLQPAIEYRQVVRRIFNEVTTGRGPYADYFAEFLQL